MFTEINKETMCELATNRRHLTEFYKVLDEIYEVANRGEFEFYYDSKHLTEEERDVLCKQLEKLKFKAERFETDKYTDIYVSWWKY
ncbi:hypothetical protein ABD91_00680 [Lysinibacillus sphaericus]|uniref:hypothetical protein n=1 Tax=Lysinibacillus sphaericus TaxID=1421 RepID=UPI0018CE7D8C|nr:hypothetical protein [Lysinibacillus sphaericus]MBG9689442.1 hypothetical protein [Lysinibacillus sphaericus]